MFIRLMRSKDKYDVTYHCTHIIRQAVEGGVEIQPCGGGPEVPAVVRMPKDADSVFVMNDGGDTIDSIYWPPRAKKSR